MDLNSPGVSLQSWGLSLLNVSGFLLYFIKVIQLLGWGEEKVCVRSQCFFYMCCINELKLVREVVSLLWWLLVLWALEQRSQSRFVVGLWECSHPRDASGAWSAMSFSSLLCGCFTEFWWGREKKGDLRRGESLGCAWSEVTEAGPVARGNMEYFSLIRISCNFQE